MTHAEGVGCYGHNGADDVAFDAAWMARALRGRPAVLRAAARRAGWAQRQRSEGVGHGLADARYKGSGACCAVVAEVHAGATLRVLRLTVAVAVAVAVDVGLAVNPAGVVNQIEGGAIQATSWVLKESAPTQMAGWADYPILRLRDLPFTPERIVADMETA